MKVLSEAKCHSNQWLVVAQSVIVTDIIDPVICELEEVFKKANQKGIVTSGLRDEFAQLRVIGEYCIQTGVAKTNPEVLKCKPADKLADGTYVWQEAWSKLLATGFIINPPFPAKVLYDYIRNGVNKKGEIIGHSPHFFGHAFDIGGGNNGIDDEDKLVTPLVGKVKGLVGTVKERNNNCLHCDCI